ncbi:unnamed protein product [Thelazia callipaeda]|uniref:WASH-7_N domain-containing protein n=1 Tax=Thelazia callipaeda TaxID=103827 RepID=A0A158RAS6_THECL|nr:unnamed protein product [Thelazia callipaeda]
MKNGSFYDSGHTVAGIAHSGNSIVDKCIITFSTLVLEVDILFEKAQSTFYKALIVYGENVDGCLSTEDGTVKMIAQFLPHLQELQIFVQRCQEVFRNIICQLYALLSSKDKLLEQAHERKLLKMWRSLGLLLSVLITLDQILRKQSTLQQHWKSYYKTMKLVNRNPSHFNAESELLPPFQQLIDSINKSIIQANLYKDCCQQIFEESLLDSDLMNERMKCITIEMYEKWDRIAADDLPHKRFLMAIVALAICHMFMFGTADKKMMRTIWNSYKKLPVFHIFGHVVWSPCEFILENLIQADRVIDHKMVLAMKAAKKAQFLQNMEVLPKEASVLANTLDEWKYRMNEELKQRTEQMSSDRIFQRISLFLKGIRFADLACRLLKTLMSCLLEEQKAISRSSLSAAFRMVEMIKAVERLFKKWWYDVLESCQEAIQYTNAELLTIINTARETIRKESVLSYRTIDTLSALAVSESALSGAVTRANLIVASVALDMACYAKIFRGSDAERIDELLSRLETLSVLGNIISRICNCSFLFWHRSFIATYFDAIISDGFCRPELFFDAVNDIETVLEWDEKNMDTGVKKSILDELYKIFEELYLKNLCEAIETDLRLTVHSHLQLDDRTPKDPMQDTDLRLVNLLEMPTLHLFDRLIDVKQYVERYLERIFYNLTSVALHDSHTYMEMSLLAKQKYGLILCESHLPFQKLNQGPDVLYVARNIDSFVESYNYNLNEQFFIEKDSKSKQLTVLTVEHVANSIRSHGMGIMNTTINHAYQFLKKKFYLFSQLLYDDRVQNQLIKDDRFFHDNVENLKNMYPVSRAQRFNTSIRRLGVTVDDLSYLDKLRILITEVGNAMGYVRLVRSGAVEVSVQSLEFLPDLDDIMSFEPMVMNAKLSTESIDAARVLDGIFDVSKKNINQSDNYLQILVEVFAPELRDSTKYEHLNFFYMIVPPLTINFIDQMLSCKGKLGRRAKQNNTFTDDGFILGVAFILILLKQEASFSALNWFQSVTCGCTEAIVNTSTVTKSMSSKSSSDPSTAIRIAKLDHYQKVQWLGRQIL